MAKQRFMLVSDMHYTTEETFDAMQTIDSTVIPSWTAGDAFGHTQREKVEQVCRDIMAEHAASPLDGVLVLGDLSLDDWDYRNLPENYCRRFREECMDPLPCPAWAIPGNHDSYPDAMWREVFGYGRQFSVDAGDVGFILLDTFRELPAHDPSGAGYTPADIGFLETELEKLAGKRIFLCAHHFAPERESEAFARIIREHGEITALFRGHTHCSGIVPTGDVWRNIPLLDIGGYGYNGMQRGDRYTFSVFDRAWAWGYQILEIDGDAVSSHHVTSCVTYRAENGVFTVPRSEEDRWQQP